jgi:hypothetical protein
MQAFMLDNTLGHKLDHNWAHTTNKLVLKFCQFLTWNLSFLFLCIKMKAKIKVESPKGYRQVGVKILSNFDMESIFLTFMHKN